MENLIDRVKIVKESEMSEIINNRLNEFNKVRENKDDVFLELCFCLMTANFKAERSWEIQKEIGKNFYVLSQDELAMKLKEMGHRFWPQRAERIVVMRDKFDELHEILNTFQDNNKMREHFVKNVKGLGMKETSHFFRNIGFNDFAIIDFHIIDILVDEGLIEKPKTITPKIYLQIESVLRNLADELNMNLAELDLYLWYLETGKVLK